MDKERHTVLMDDVSAIITQEEWNQGWHYCFEFDGMVMNSKECNCQLALYESLTEKD